MFVMYGKMFRASWGQQNKTKQNLKCPDINVPQFYCTTPMFQPVAFITTLLPFSCSHQTFHFRVQFHSNNVLYIQGGNKHTI